MFETTRAVVQPQTPTTALVLFPSFTKHVDRMSFIADNKLRFQRWMHSDDPAYVMASVKLPPANLHTALPDPVAGRFPIPLPHDLTRPSAFECGRQHGPA